MNPLAIVIYIGTIIVSVIIALLLARFSKSSTKLRIKGGEKSVNDKYPSSEDFLRKAILHEIKDVVYSKPRRARISGTLSDIFAKELRKLLDSSNQELSMKYKTLLKDAEIPWQKYKKVLTVQKETEAVVHSIAEGLVVVDADGNVIMMNPSAEKLLEVTSKNKIGSPVFEDLKNEQWVSFIKSPGMGGKGIELISKEDETRKILRSSNAVIENENGNTVGMVSVLNDITKQRKLDQVKLDFICNVTHELRTPLIATQKAISLLLDSKTEQIPRDKQNKFLSIADVNLKKLNLLIDDLLDLSKLVSGKMNLKKESFSIEKVVDESIESLDAWAKAKSINVEKRFQQNLPNVNIDPSRIGQVLDNLIGNAIKFTPSEGHITVDIISERNTNEVRVIVGDTGIGIDPNNISKVFDRFYQTGERAPTDISGTGIGLSLVKEIIDLHEGDVWAENKMDSGTRFSFKLKAAC